MAQRVCSKKCKKKVLKCNLSTRLCAICEALMLVQMQGSLNDFKDVLGHLQNKGISKM